MFFHGCVVNLLFMLLFLAGEKHRNFLSAVKVKVHVFLVDVNC